jgi:hypothetical protein
MTMIARARPAISNAADRGGILFDVPVAARTVAVCRGSRRGQYRREVFLLKGVRKRKMDPFYDLSKVASATECTGLIPSLPQSEEEDENYANLYSTHDQPPAKNP